MAKKGTLVLFRHGQTDYNLNHLMTGTRDVPLNAVGEEQAREAGRLITAFVFDKAYSSTLSRAFNTAAMALETSGGNAHLKKADGSWNIEQRVEIIECDAGDFTGRNHRTDPEIIAFKRSYDTPLPGGESDRQLVERVQKFFDAELKPRLEQGETVLVVCHAGVMRAFDVALGIVPPPVGDDIWTRSRKVNNATPLVAEYEDGRLVNHFNLENPQVPPAANQNRPPKKDGFRFG